MATRVLGFIKAIAAMIQFFLLPVVFLLKTASGLHRQLREAVLAPDQEAALTIHGQGIINPSAIEIERLKHALKEASSYDTWLATAQQLDEIEPPNPKGIEANQQAVKDYTKQFPLFVKRHRGVERQTGFTGFERCVRPEIFARTYTGVDPALSQHVKAVIDRIDITVERSTRKGYASEEVSTMLSSAASGSGETALVLKGGGVFALHHLGVTRALMEQGLLPNIIFGTSTGAWIAVLLATMTDEEYLDAFDGLLKHVLNALKDGGQGLEDRIDWTALFWSRRRDFQPEVYDQERDVFGGYVRNVLGLTTTFKEAYKKTGRIVNIEIACDTPGTPNLLNHVTTPNIILASAAQAAQSDDYDVAPSLIWEKSDYNGEIHPWAIFDESPDFRARRQLTRPKRGSAHLSLYTARDDPIRRMAQIWNVKHHIISQPRPCILPFVRSVYYNRAQRHVFADIQAFIRRTLIWQWHFRMRQYCVVRDVAYRTQALLIEDRIVAAPLMLAPDTSFEEIEKVVYDPDERALERCVVAGERSVWECAGALHADLDIEIALEQYSRQNTD